MLTTIVDDFGSGYVHTTVVHSATDGFLWVRNIGVDRPRALGTVPEALRPTLEAISGPVTFQAHLPMDRPETWRVFPAPGPSSCAKRLAVENGSPTAATRELLRSTGAALAELHARRTPGLPALPGPQGPERLSRWLGGAAGPRASDRLREEALRYLGESRMRTAHRWCADLRSEDAKRPGAVLHGAAGLGALIPSVEPGADGSSAVMLTGEHLATGPAEFDLGWIAGDLVEHREVSPHPAQEQQPLLDSLLAGYGPSADLDTVSRAAVLRMFVHVHDFATYLGWHDSIRTHLELLADAVDTSGGDLLKQPLRPKARRT